MKQWQIPTALGLSALLVVVLLILDLMRAPRTVELAKPRDLPDIPLYDETGNTLALNAASGGWRLLFPGFTYCPDICPTTLSRLALVADDLAPVRVILFSVDPERDAPQRLREYVEYFHPSFGAWVPASISHLNTAAPALGIAYRKVQLQHDYTVDHSTAMPLIAPDGRIIALFPEFFEPEALLLEVRRIVEAHGTAGLP